MIQGLLARVERAFENFGEVTDLQQRGEMLDEGLEIITGLQSGDEFNYSGNHYRLVYPIIGMVLPVDCFGHKHPSPSSG